MSYVVLYRKWRPKTFDDLVGQESIAKILKSQVVNNRIAHAYLFSGGRGTGKTSTAKIFSRAVNCTNTKDGNPCNECETCVGISSGNIMDVVEIDAASNNSVDDVRGIRDEVFYTPSVTKFRVYIIDEVHMLSTGAFNALLKILEEPPKHAIFILATTEPHKLPATILSRCQKYEFKQISNSNIISRLKVIADANGVKVDEDAYQLIARLADGALRDAISIFDQSIWGTEVVTKQKVIEVVGLSTEQTIIDFTRAIAAKDTILCIKTVDELAKSGKDLAQFISILIRFFRDVLIFKTTRGNSDVFMVSDDKEAMKELCNVFTEEKLINTIISLSDLEANLKWATLPRVMIEIEIVKLCNTSISSIDAALEERLSKLESVISSGVFTERLNIKNNVSKSESQVIRNKPTIEKNVKNNDHDQVSGINGEKFEDWEKVISLLKTSGKMVLYANLIGVKAVKTDDNTVSLVFSKSAGDFGKTLISKNENLAVLKNAINKVTGQEFNVRFMIQDDTSKTAQKSESKVDNVVEMAKKYDIPLNIIEE